MGSDAVDQLAGHPWEDVDGLLELMKREAAEAETIPESVALVFYDDDRSRERRISARTPLG